MSSSENGVHLHVFRGEVIKLEKKVSTYIAKKQTLCVKQCLGLSLWQGRGKREEGHPFTDLEPVKHILKVKQYGNVM